MKSTSETGHAKNVANFNNLISAISALSTSYAPTKASLKLAGLTALSVAAADSLNQVITKSIAYNNAVNSRTVAYGTLRPLATRLVAALQSTEANFELLKDAKTINRKIQGKRAQAIEPISEGSTVPKSISVSQQSYDQLLQHFTALVGLLSSEPSYQPTENELKIDTLQDYITELHTLNASVNITHIAISNARINRSNVLYKSNTGLVDIALSVKQYIKSIFGAGSEQYKQVFKINFKNYVA